MELDVSLIFQIAGIGIVVAFITTILDKFGQKDYNMYVVLIAFVIVLFRVTTVVDDLFDKVKSVFLFQ
ncbi:MAG: stage III sporulation protein AC [Bacillaceae bacterium]